MAAIRLKGLPTLQVIEIAPREATHRSIRADDRSRLDAHRRARSPSRPLARVPSVTLATSTYHAPRASDVWSAARTANSKRQANQHV